MAFDDMQVRPLTQYAKDAMQQVRTRREQKDIGPALRYLLLYLINVTILAQGLRRSAEISVSWPTVITPDSFVVVLNYSHPSVLLRSSKPLYILSSWALVSFLRVIEHGMVPVY